MPHGCCAENEQEDAECGEDPRLDHRHRVQERADRRGGDHGSWQPAVQWHHGILGKTKQEQGKDDEKQRRLTLKRRRRQDSAFAKLEGAGHVISQDDGRHEEHFGGAQKIDDVLASASLGLGRLLVPHEGIRGQGQCFIEQEQRKQVG